MRSFKPASILGFVLVVAALVYLWLRPFDWTGGHELIVEIPGDPARNARILADRLAAFGVERAAVEPLEDVVRVRVPKRNLDSLPAIRRLLTDPGDIEFHRTLERSDDTLYTSCWAMLRGRDGEPGPLRIGPEELPVESRGRYAHGLCWYRIRWPDRDWFQPERFPPKGKPWLLCVLDEHGITQRCLEGVRIEQGMHPTSLDIYYEVKEAYRERMAALTEIRDDEQYLAIIVDGEIVAAPVLRAQLTDSVMVTIRGGDDVRWMAALLSTDSLPGRGRIAADRPLE